MVLDRFFGVGEDLMMALGMFIAVALALWPKGEVQRTNIPTKTLPRRSITGEIWLLLVPVGLVLALADPVSGILIAATGPVMRWFRARQRESREALAKRDALPEVLDLIALSIGAGMTASNAIRLVHTEGPIPVRAAFGSVIAQAEAGQPLARTIPVLFDELGESYEQLVTALVASVRDGAPLAELLARLADNARLSRRRRAEERGRRLPVVIMFPLAGCSMPAVLIGTIVPVVIVGLRSTSL